MDYDGTVILSQVARFPVASSGVSELAWHLRGSSQARGRRKRRTVTRLAIASVALLMVLLAVACSATEDQAGVNTAADTAEGTVVDFVADRGVERLTIETENGDLLTFEIGDDLPAIVWDRRHLEAHESSGQRIIVTFSDEEGTLVATKLEEGGF